MTNRWFLIQRAEDTHRQTRTETHTQTHRHTQTSYSLLINKQRSVKYVLNLKAEGETEEKEDENRSERKEEKKSDEVDGQTAAVRVRDM